MYKKLVVYDQWHFTEVDPICLKRKAHELKEFILTKIPKNDPYQIHSGLLLILDAAIRGEITRPYDRDSDLISGQYLWDSREGLLPAEYSGEFNRRFSGFSVNVRGIALDQVAPFNKDGITYAYMELEEPGDWPDVVLKLEDDRRRARMGADYVPVKPY